MSTPVLHVQHLVKRFGEFFAVNDISFDIRPGEILGLLGPNGAGKTTTIQMLLGVVTPTTGSIQMFGLDLAANREVILQQVNFSSTHVSLPQALTVEENLWVIARLYGLSHIQERVDDIVKRLEMEEFRHKVTRKLSSGQSTRLGLAKAFLTEPRILFLDEPTASLDPDIAQKIRSFLKEERRSSGLSVLYTSHNMHEMEEMTDRIIFLQRGKIVAEGTAQEIVARFGQADLEEVFVKFAREKEEAKGRVSVLAQRAASEGPRWTRAGETLPFTSEAAKLGRGEGRRMKVHRIYALVARHLYLYRRSLPRMMEIFYWPFLDLVIWGFITVYLMKFQGQIPGAVTFFLGALILWDVLFRAQQGITISFLEEIWARNLMNLFASPLKPNEFLAATMVMSAFKVIAVSVVMVVCAGLFYSYNIFVIGMWLIPFVLNLVMTGWIIGALTTALIMRFGQEAEVLAWSMVFMFQPISCVFYPMEVL